jgi:hypothetical protein
MKKVLWGIAGVITLTMIILLAIGLSYGEELRYNSVSLVDYTTGGEESATCLAYHSEVISTYEKYEEFLDDCSFTIGFDYDEEYFTSNVFVVFYYDKSSSVRPRNFYDYLFMTENHEIIKVRYHYTLWFLQKKDATPYFYFIEMTRDQIASGDVLFD